jgi:hypothetical protein
MGSIRRSVWGRGCDCLPAGGKGEWAWSQDAGVEVLRFAQDDGRLKERRVKKGLTGRVGAEES